MAFALFLVALAFLYCCAFCQKVLRKCCCSKANCGGNEPSVSHVSIYADNLYISHYTESGNTQNEAGELPAEED